MNTDFNPYQLYTEDKVLSNNPLELVIALYEGAVDSSVNARACFATGDIPGRTKFINKMVSIFTELTASLDHKRGGEVSKNLDRLYNYMQRRVIEAQFQKNPAHLEEVERLLSTMLEGWRGAKNTPIVGQPAPEPMPAIITLPARVEVQREYEYEAVPVSAYGGYMGDYGDFNARQAYSF